MKLLFEDKAERRNFLNCPDVCKSGISRFSPAPILNHIPIRYWKEYNQSAENYIIMSGVNHSPQDWTGYEKYSNVKSLFEYLDKKYLHDLVNNKALLLLDQSLEGYHNTWIFDFFHEECDKYNIDPSNIIYLTGNVDVERDYKDWLLKNPQEKKLNTYGYMHFESDMYQQLEELAIDTTTKTNLRYKKRNPIKLFNCLNKRDRNHRAWFYTKLYQNDLLQDGLINMNTFNSGHYMDGQSIDPETILKVNTTLPMWIDEPNDIHNDSHYIRRFKFDVCLDSYLSVISEAHFADESNTIFISEKTFKIIGSRHPFIILGNKGSLKKLKEFGYKTFDGFIDESYDDLDSFDRMEAIIKILHDLKNRNDLYSWYKSMQPILNYNYNVFKNRSLKKNKIVKKIEKIYAKKFGGINV